jgi:hypothetical protein
MKSGRLIYVKIYIYIHQRYAANHRSIVEGQIREPGAVPPPIDFPLKPSRVTPANWPLSPMIPRSSSSSNSSPVGARVSAYGRVRRGSLGSAKLNDILHLRVRRRRRQRKMGKSLSGLPQEEPCITCDEDDVREEGERGQGDLASGTVALERAR